MTRHNTPESRHFFNNLNRQVKSLLTKFRQTNLVSKFTDLKNFNQSCSKHWKTINELQNSNSSSIQPFTLISDDVTYSDNMKIAEKFASILSTTFGAQTNLENLPDYPVPSTFEELTISRPEFESALQACNKKSAPGNDGISNKLIYHSPINIKSLILLLFQFSFKIGHIPHGS